MKKMNFKNPIRLLLIVLIWSCSDDRTILEPPKNASQENLVDLEEAIGLASILEFPSENVGNSARKKKGDDFSPTIKTVGSSFSVPDQSGESALHVVNYEEGGFVIISGDNRLSPIQAIGEMGSISLQDKSLPDGLVLWMAGTTELVEDTRLRNVPRSNAMIQSWDPCETLAASRQTNSSCPEDCNQNYYSKVDPLLNTKWGQGVGYNNNAPILGCSNYSNGRAPSGCVATAVAQVMKYHQAPNYFSWSTMPNNTGSAATSLLMSDIGNNVGMNYGCSGSGAFTNNAVDVLKDDYGYQSASYSNFEFYSIKSDLVAGRPAILSAKTTENCFLVWCIASNGHAWVVDGYIENEVWDYYCENGTVSISLHMNWGWNGNYDGWFSYSGWNAGGNNYAYDKKMLHNIRP